MNQMIAPKAINFNELVKNSNVNLSSSVQTKMTTIINDEFTEEQQQWYIANLFMYMNYHPTNDYPINLEHVFKMIGFANKENAKRTLKNNFTKDEDYKTLLVRKDEQKHTDETRGGHNQEDVMLNVDTFKNLCMLAKTENGKQIRKYYVKLENIYNKIIKEEIESQKLIQENTQKLLHENEIQLETAKKQLSKEKTLRNKMLNRRCFDVTEGEYVYIFQDNLNEPDSIIKIGKTKNLADRERFYSNTNKSGGIIHYTKCIDCGLIERLAHHMLDKFRENKMQEWFKVDLDLVKQTIETIVSFTDDQIKNIETFIPSVSEFLLENKLDIDVKNDNTISIDVKNDNTISIDVKNDNTSIKPDDMRIKPDDTRIKPDDFKSFIDNYCEIGDQFFTAKEELTKAFRIYTRNTIEKSIKAKLDLFLQTNFKSGVEFYENIRRNVWRGFRLKPLTFSVNDENNIQDYEQFISDQCQINYLNRISYVDFFEAFTSYKTVNDEKYILTHDYKQKIQKYLISKFANGRVHLSDKSKANHLFGILGASLKNTSGLKESKRTCKKVSKIDFEKKTCINTWDSLTIAAKELNIPRSTLATLIKFETIKDGYLYKYINTL
jgi:phage anti-repressor protein